MFINENKFNQKIQKLKHAGVGEIVDVFIYTGWGKEGKSYSLYLCCQNGIMYFNNIDKGNFASLPFTKVPELHSITLSPGAIDCDPKGNLLFDLKSASNNHQIKSCHQMKFNEKFDYALEGDKKILKWFNNYVIEVKAEKNQDKIQIYDFDNKLSLFNANFPQIYQIEVEHEERRANKKPNDGDPLARAIYMQVLEKSGKLAIYQLTEMENNIKIENLLKKSMFKEAQNIAIKA